MDTPITVSELTQAIKKQLETRFPFVWVKGEISNLKEQSSGHFYFTLKDSESQISVVLFKGNAKLLRQTPKSGDQVTLKGELSVYPPRGGYQIIVRELEFSGLGDLLLQLHMRKAKLETKGYFDPKHKKPLPKLPKKIGVITSPTGAVIQDILHILSRRFSGFQLILNPVKVQGEGAAEEIAKAIMQCNEYNLADVLIVGRGGGSLEDLWAFNEEMVADAIFNSKIPIISAVGHETDYSIADFVADVRAPTPSAAAELVICEKIGLLQDLLQAKKHIVRHIQATCSKARESLKGILRHSILSSPVSILEPLYQKIDLLQEKLEDTLHQNLEQKKVKIESIKKQIDALRPNQQLRVMREKLMSTQKTIDAILQKEIQKRHQLLNKTILETRFLTRLKLILQNKRKDFFKLSSHLQSLDPKNILTKGYCILFAENNNSAILSINQIAHEQKLKVLMQDGTVATTVDEIYVRKP